MGSLRAATMIRNKLLTACAAFPLLDACYFANRVSYLGIYDSASPAAELNNTPVESKMLQV
jgi:hypothetical protein